MLTLTNKDIREYRVQDLLYHFVLFHHIPSIRSIMYMPILGGGESDNAILAYCYSDRRAGLSYKSICCAKLSDDGTVEYHTDELPPRSLTIREGGLECPAEVIDEDDEDMEQFRKVADSIKKNYGYHHDECYDKCSVDDQKNEIEDIDIVSGDHKLALTTESLKLLQELLTGVLDCFRESEQEILRYRYGLDDGKTRSIEETEDRFGITREDIRRLDAKVLWKIRRPSRRRSHCKLEDYLGR